MFTRVFPLVWLAGFGGRSAGDGRAPVGAGRVTVGAGLITVTGMLKPLTRFDQLLGKGRRHQHPDRDTARSALAPGRAAVSKKPAAPGSGRLMIPTGIDRAAAGLLEGPPNGADF